MTDTATTDTLPPARWARVEIMGHRVHHGLITEVEQFGTKMLRVDVYGDGDVPIATHDYGGTSIYGLTPCTEGYAREREKSRREMGYGTPLAIAAPIVPATGQRCGRCGAQKGEPCALSEAEQDQCEVPF